MAAVFNEGIIVQGDVTYTGSLVPGLSRSNLTQATERFKINPVDWRVWDAMATNLPGTSATDDLALTGGTFATNSPLIGTSDLKGAGSTTRYARTSFQLPASYVAGQTCQIRAKVNMKTTVADTAATVDFEVYRSGDDGTISSDLCATAAQSMNSLTAANKDFTITATTLLPGDTLDIRLAVLVNDAATVTAVIGQVGGVELLLGTKG